MLSRAIRHDLAPFVRRIDPCQYVIRSSLPLWTCHFQSCKADPNLEKGK
jgi:hypothetical protein